MSGKTATSKKLHEQAAASHTAKTKETAEGELKANHYVQPEPTPDNPLSEFDYSALTGDAFNRYFEFVEGRIVAEKSHAMPVRNGNGLNRNKSYVFEKYRAYPIKKARDKDFMEVVGIELVSSRPQNVGLVFPLEHAVTLNHYLGGATSKSPTDIYLLAQDQTL